MKNKFDIKLFIIDTLYFIGGSILFALGVYTFALNAKFAPGGLSGLGLILAHFTPFPVGVLTFALNIPLIILCAKTVGSKFIYKSLWAMVVNTIFIDLVFPFFPVFPINEYNKLLVAIFTGVFMGAGIAIIYMRGASTGGTDFIIMAIKKKRPHFSVGQISFIIDGGIILLGGFAFKDIDSVLYGVIASFITTLVMDNILYGAGSGKLAIVITEHGHEVADAIGAEVMRGSTLLDATGSYTGLHKNMLLCVCSKSEIYKVRNIARAIDPDSMIMITEANEVIGEGFIPPPIPGNEHLNKPD